MAAAVSRSRRRAAVGRHIEAGVGDRVDQQLELELADVARDHGREVAARAVPGDHIRAQGAVAARPRRRRVRVLGREPVVVRWRRGARGEGERAADGLGRARAADHPAAAVEVGDGAAGVRRRVDPRGDAGEPGILGVDVRASPASCSVSASCRHAPARPGRPRVPAAQGVHVSRISAISGSSTGNLSTSLKRATRSCSSVAEPCRRSADAAISRVEALVC